MAYADAASQRDASTCRAAPSDATSGTGGVTRLQCRPLSRVTETMPSLLPVQMTPRAIGDSEITSSAPQYSTPMLSGVSPPEIPCLDLSLRVRSCEMTCQL